MSEVRLRFKTRLGMGLEDILIRTTMAILTVQHAIGQWTADRILEDVRRHNER